MLTVFAVDQFNHILRQEGWPLKRLQPFKGKTIHFRLPPILDLRLIVQENGELLHSHDQPEADVTLLIMPALLPGLIARDESVYDKIETSGDSGFANELIAIGKHIRPGIEQNLGKIIGDIPAHRVVQAGNDIFQWHINLTRNVSEAMGEYWQEEQPLLVKSDAARKASEQIKVLQQDTDRLKARINRIIQATNAD